MSHNVGAIFVRASQETVAAQVEAYWRKSAARLMKAPREALSLPTLSLATTHRLGYLIAPTRNGWVGVHDSERYQADHRLARHLARTLSTAVIWLILSGATDEGELKYLGGMRVHGYDAAMAALTRERLSMALLYFDKFQEEVPAGQQKRYRILGFENVKFASYDTGPVEKASYTRSSVEDVQETFNEQLEAGNDQAALALLNALPDRKGRQVLDAIAWVGLDTKQARRAVLSLYRALISKNGRNVSLLASAVEAALPENDKIIASDVLRRLARVPRAGQQMAYVADRLHKAGFPAQAMDLFEAAARKKGLNLERWCQALWTLVDLTKSQKKPDRRRIEGWLDAALRAKQTEPYLHYYAACLRARMGDREQAVRHVALAKKYRYPDAADLLEDEDLAALRRDPAFGALFRRRGRGSRPA
jgi:hypothetical protein